MSAVLVVGSLALAGWLVVVIRRKIFPSDKEGAAKSPLARDSRDTTVAPLEINFEERQKVLKHQGSFEVSYLGVIACCLPIVFMFSSCFAYTDKPYEYYFVASEIKSL